MKRLISLVCVLLLAVGCLCPVCGTVSAEEPVDATLHTEGNLLLNGAGEAVRLLGINIPYLGWDAHAESAVMNALDIALGDWDSNAIRLPVTPELWLGAGSAGYRALVDRVIQRIADEGKYVILDNHSFYLPDQDDIAFWSDAAARYKDHPNVLYELFNEPAACTWQQYFEGGPLTYRGENDWGQEDDITIQSCGIPKLLETVRATGAKNVCILPGINWSFDLSTCTEENFRAFAKSLAESNHETDTEGFVDRYVEQYFPRETTGNGIMYSTHPYPTKPVDWDLYLKDTALAYPILVGECGPTEKADGFVRNLTDNDRSYLDMLTEYVDRYELNITPWAWGAWPYLNQEPSDKLSAYGSYMLKYFQQSHEAKAVTLYDGTDYTGRSYTLEAGTYTAARLSALGFDLAKLQSASAKDDYYQYTVTLYENEDYSGGAYTFVPDTASTGSSVCGFTPKSMRIDRAVPENILPGHATITATGSVENQTPENLIDGKNTTFWKYTGEGPCEVVISLDDVYAINGITLAHAAEASMMSVFNASDYTVSVSTDGETFTRIIDVTENSLGLCEYDFEQVLAAYIKIKFTKGSIIDNQTYYLAEAMAYGTPYTGSTEGMNIRLGVVPAAAPAAGGADLPVLPIVLSCVFGGILLVTVGLTVFFLKKGKKAKRPTE